MGAPFLLSTRIEDEFVGSKENIQPCSITIMIGVKVRRDKQIKEQ